jgi:hypothetical protein
VEFWRKWRSLLNGFNWVVWNGLGLGGGGEGLTGKMSELV